MTQPTNEVTISLQDLVRFVLRGLVWAALFGGVAAAAAYVLSAREPAQFRAEATLLVARTTGGFSQFGLSPVTAPPIDLSAYRAAAASDRVLAEAARQLGSEAVGEGDIRSLRGRTNTFVVGEGRDSSLLGVEARATSPRVAADRANALAEALVDWDRRRATESLTRVTTTLEQQIDALGEQIRAVQAAGDGGDQTQVDGLIRLRADQQQQLAYARALVASAEGLLSVMQSADTTPRQIAPRPVMSAAVAALLTVAITYGLLLLFTALRSRPRSVEDVVAANGLSLLAQFPLTTKATDSWRLLEAAHYLRANLLFANHAVHPKVFLVTSAREHEGKTTIACELAEGFARNGYRALLVDADLRSPAVAERYDVLGTRATVSTTRDWLAASADVSHNVLRVALEDDNELFVVPQFSSAEDAAEALSRGFSQALARWEHYDVIVIDAAPILAVADALTIAPLCTGTVLVADAEQLAPDALARARELLEGVGATISGVVANRVRQPRGRDASSSAYGYGYGNPYGEQTRKAGSRSGSRLVGARATTAAGDNSR